ncbi:Leucine-rich repeat [Sesbania bispinosa]|nr:Leucine-rich repeat [Sesbania bispinosa]
MDSRYMASCSKPAKELGEEGESRMTPNWLDLPREITANILQRVDTFEIVTSACRVCPLWWKICKEPFICGQLEDINIEYFCSDALLNYIANSTSQLRRLGLVRCWGISDKGLSEVAKKLPLLEELDISFCFLCKDSLEVIGRCCPLLKVLKFNQKRVLTPSGNGRDDDAVAIAKTMPQLRQLYISGNPLTNDGLLAILDGCPLLQSLALRECCYIYLVSSVVTRCREQIKDLCLPCDFLEDVDHYYLDYLTGNSYG